MARRRHAPGRLPLALTPRTPAAAAIAASTLRRPLTRTRSIATRPTAARFPTRALTTRAPAAGLHLRLSWLSGRPLRRLGAPLATAARIVRPLDLHIVRDLIPRPL